MEKFTYKVAFFTNEIDFGKDMIIYKGTTIPGNHVTGIGLILIKASNQIAGQLLGGLVGAALAQKGTFSNSEIDKNIANMPNALGQMIITYSPDGIKQKVIRIPISSNDPNCKRLIESASQNFGDRFIGFGKQMPIEKALKISQKGAWIILAIIFLIVIGFVVFSVISEGQF